MNSLHRFATDILTNFNPFDFVAAVFYYDDCWPNRVLEWLLVIVSTLTIAYIDPLGGLATITLYLLGYALRDGCAVCSAAQGIGICIAAVATVLGKFGFIPAFGVFLGYAAVFALWLMLVWLIYRDS